jgi:type II secretory pathway pseudopilin PulG
MPPPAQRAWKRSTRIAAFTLAEILVAMAIILVVATITVVAVRRITDDARLSSAINAVVAGLDNARAIAMRDNAYVMAAFVVRWSPTGGTDQVTELMLAKWTGETYDVQAVGFSFDSSFQTTVNRFAPVHDILPRPLPAGIKVAATWYDVPDSDDTWITQPELRLVSVTPSQEWARGGRLLGMIFAPDGSIVTDIVQSGAQREWVDLDNDRAADGWTGGESANWTYDRVNDEPHVEPVAFFAIYDDRDARKNKTLDWKIKANYVAELQGPDGYIATRAERIHFNRFTGVAMR